MKNPILWAIVALLLLAGVFYLYTGSPTETNTLPDGSSVTDPAEGPLEYESDIYAFSFQYPNQIDIREYTPEIISVGDAKGEDAFEADVEVQVVERLEGGEYDGYEEFLAASIRNLCAADGPGATIYCTERTDIQPYENSSGITGERFFITRVHEDLNSGEKESEDFGPIYAFMISPDSASSTWTTLLVRPPSNADADDIETGLIEDIADTVQVDRADLRP